MSSAIDQMMQSAVGLLQAGRVEESLRVFDEIVRLRPDWAGAHNNRGGALLQLNRFDEAAEALRRTVALNPAHVDAWCNLAFVLVGKGLLGEAMHACEQALRVRPDYPRARLNLSNALMKTGRAADAVEQCRALLRADANHLHAHSVMLYCQLFLSEMTPAMIFDAHRAWAARFADPLTPASPVFGVDRDPDRRLRVGYVSGDFREHPVGRAVLPLFLNHDGGACETIVFSDEEKPDGLTERLRGLAKAWHRTPGMSSAQLAELIRAERIDVLVDLSLHMVGERLTVFARRPAPVQVSFIGYAATTGLSAMDYRLTDAHVDPPGSESFNTEMLHRLPKSFYCYHPDGTEPAPASERPNRPVTFGSFNNPAKISPAALDAWCAILREIPESRLQMVVYESGRETHFTREFEQRGIALSRITFSRPRPRNGYLAFYDEIDVALDPFPYNGGVTTCDALWMGVPVISLRGETSVGRAGVSILNNVGLTQLLASDVSEYVRLAVELARDLPRVAGYRSALRERMRASPITDSAGFTRDVESAYRTMWRRWCATPPR